ncbi:MAG: endonuclease/exonuclease/phosphatase family protein [Pseudomonadales bacterium]|nr:endonuclease/exonuclease/phosphatase family protein [Pseudomonadales bacterium]
MKRFFLILFFCQSICASPQDVVIASFNTFWLYDDQPSHERWWNDQRGAMGQTYTQALDLVAAAIVESDADVIALQEVESHDVVSDLVSRLSSHHDTDYPHFWTGQGTDSTTGQDVALLSKYPRDGELQLHYKSERESFLTEVDPGNEDDTGLSKVLRVDLNVEGTVIHFFVTHLKSQRGGAVSDNQRLAQASIIRRITKPLINAGGSVIVMGDLNADRGSKTLHRLRGFDDSDADLYQSVHNDNFSGLKVSYTFAGRPQQLDHILLTRDLYKEIISGSFQNSHDKETSDHALLKVTIDL